MLGLPKNQNKQAVSGINESGDTRPQGWTFRRRSARTVLVPMMVGSTIILMPWREDGGRMDWPHAIPPIE